MCFIVFVQELVNRSVPYSNIFVLSLSLSSFSLSSVVAAFLRLFLSRALPHYDSPSFLCSYVLNLRPPPSSLSLLLKDSPFTSVLHLSILSFPLQLRPPLLPISLSHFCVAFRVFLRLFLLSHFLGPSFPYRRLALPSTPSSPSVSACSNMATRCPITRLVFATVFPPSYIHRRPRRRKGPHQPPRDAPFHFPLFLSRSSIRSYSSAGIASRSVIALSCLSPRCELPCPIFRCKLGFTAAKQ